jgi:hypothetical protein
MVIMNERRRTRVVFGTLTALMCVTRAISAQGTVIFQNHGEIFLTEADRRVYAGAVGATLLVGTNYAAQLWYGAPGETILSPVPDAIRLFRVPTTTFPGTWNTAPTALVVLPGVNVGQTTQLEVRVWDIQKFESFGAALAGGGEVSRSQPFNYIVPQPGSVPAAYSMDNLRAFASLSIPEPSTLALFASALVFLVVGRRLASRERQDQAAR